MFHVLKPGEVFNRLGVSERGLSLSSASKHLSKHGKNKLSEMPGKSFLKMIAEQFSSVLVIILIIASVISAFVGEVTDAAVIFVIVILNAVIGFYLEAKADKSIKSLSSLLSLKTKVIRDGSVYSIDSTLLVPGDVVILESGAKVPADLYIFKSQDLRVDQSSLTGESVAVAKDVCTLQQDTPLAERANTAYMGTTVSAGKGRGVVTATGMSTEFGKIAGLAYSIGTKETRLKKKLDSLGRKLGLISLLIAFGIFLLGIFQERGVFEMFILGISLAVAVIPEGLPAVVTITLAIGVRSMVKKKCLIRNLSATETLGEVSAICTDKTGTLTQNEMAVRRLYQSGRTYSVSGEGYGPDGQVSLDGSVVEPDRDLMQMIEACVLCNNADVVFQDERYLNIGDPTEGALISLGMKNGFTKDVQEADRELVKEIGFTSSRKMMSSIYQENGKFILYAKGAPEKILDRSVRNIDGSVINDSEKSKLQEIYSSYAGEGLRVLAVAFRELDSLGQSDSELESDFIFAGFVGISDPPRPEVPEAVRKAHEAGIEVIMITGDSPLTARAIGAEIGIDAEVVISGVELDSMDEDQLTEKLKTCRIFARVTPEHKYRIVSLLQSMGTVTAMTGDGVNDAPALKKADVGIAMGIKGTDVAKDASDMILLDDNFASIIDGIEEGRRQYENIQRFTNFLLSANFGEIVAILIAMLMKLPVILFAVQILWINLATDGILALALGTDDSSEGSMKRPPRSHHTSILTGEVMRFLLIMGVWIGGLTVGIFWYMIKTGVPEDEARSTAFIGLIIFEMIHMFNFREAEVSVFRKRYLDNKFLNIAWVLTFLTQLLIIYLPSAQKIFYTTGLSVRDWLILFILGSTVLLVSEIYRVVSIKTGSQRHAP